MYSHSIESFWYGLCDNAQSVARSSKLYIASESPGCSGGNASFLLLAERSATTESAHHTPHQNHLLDALPLSDFERIASHLELVPMPLGEVLYESGVQLRYVYFPTTSILSLLYVMEDGASAEIAIVGNEGILGISLFMGGETTPSRAIVQSGEARLSAQGGFAQGRVRAVRSDDAFLAALHPGADHADGADRGMQSAPFGGAAVVPLVVAEPRSSSALRRQIGRRTFCRLRRDMPHCRFPSSDRRQDSIWMNIATTAAAITAVAAQPNRLSRRVTVNSPIMVLLDAMRIITTMIGAEMTPLMTAA